MNDVVKVEVQRSGRRFEAEAVLDLAADVQTVWDTITDYGALPRFMPGIRACRVVEREALAGTGEQLVVEQEGEFRFLLFAQSMTVLLNIEHQPLKMAEAKAVAEALKSHEGVLALGGGAVLNPDTRALLEGHRVLFLKVGLADAATGAAVHAPRRAAHATALHGADRAAPAAAAGHRQRGGAAEPGRAARGRGGRGGAAQWPLIRGYAGLAARCLPKPASRAPAFSGSVRAAPCAARKARAAAGRPAPSAPA